MGHTDGQFGDPMVMDVTGFTGQNSIFIVIPVVKTRIDDP
jgi:hypothetical protein